MPPRCLALCTAFVLTVAVTAGATRAVFAQGEGGESGRDGASGAAPVAPAAADSTAAASPGNAPAAPDATGADGSGGAAPTGADGTGGGGGAAPTGADGTGGGGGEGGPPAGQGGPPAGGQAGGASPPATGFHPSYSSKYEVNRSTTTWTQQLSLNTTVNDVTINNTTSVALGKDSSIGRDQSNNTSNTSISYAYNDQLSFAGSLGFTRNQSSDRSSNRTEVKNDRWAGEIDYTRALGPVGGVFGLNLGTQRDRRVDPLTSNRESNGPYAEATGAFDQTGKSWDWKLTTRLRSARLESRESETGTVTNDRNRDIDLGYTLNWKLPGTDEFSLTVNRDLSRSQQPIRRTVGGETIVEQETTHQVSQGLVINTGSTPLRHLELDGSFTLRNNDINRVVDLDRSTEALDKLFSGNLAYQFPDSTRITSKLDVGVQRTTYDAENRKFLDGDISSRALGGSFARALGRKASITARGNYQLQSYLFDDTEANKDDRDVVRADLGITGDYDPLPKMKTEMRFSFQHNQTVFVDRSKSSGNQTQQTYTINPVLTYDITPRLAFREDASAIAVARVFDFDEDRNKLSRTTEFRTSIDAKLHRKLDMELRHVQRIILDGSYTRDPRDAIRKFGKASETVTRDVTLRFDYRPLTGGALYFRGNRRLNDVTTLSQQGGGFVEVVNTTEFNEIEMGGSINYTLSFGLNVNARLRRVQNWNVPATRRDNYFVGDVTITQRF